MPQRQNEAELARKLQEAHLHIIDLLGACDVHGCIDLPPPLRSKAAPSVGATQGGLDPRGSRDSRDRGSGQAP